jgi:hypothetical protein
MSSFEMLQGIFQIWSNEVFRRVRTLICPSLPGSSKCCSLIMCSGSGKLLCCLDVEH